jgi:hypothetical protein
LLPRVITRCSVVTGIPQSQLRQATGSTTAGLVFDPRQGHKFLSIPYRPDRRWDLPSLLPSGNRVLSWGGGGGVNCPIRVGNNKYVNIAEVKNGGSIPPLLMTLMVWCLMNWVQDVWGSGGIDPCIFNLGTRWRWERSFTPVEGTAGNRGLRGCLHSGESDLSFLA